MRSRAFNLGVVLIALLAVGWATRPLADPAWAEVRQWEPAFQAQRLESTLGQGLTFGVLGGFRAVMADFLWLRVNGHWENRDLPATQKMIDVVTTVDPRPLYFWINGARMIAYDMPHWRYDAEAKGQPLDPVVQQRIDDEQSRAALLFLARALEAHPRDPVLLFEIGNIHFRRRHDLAAAGEFYRAAAEQPDAPFYAARIYAVVLEQQGRTREAYEWLCRVHAALPADNPLANAELVLERIRRLEAALGVASGEHYVPPGR